jgi:hypothetical protein
MAQPIFLASWEAEIRRIIVQGWPISNRKSLRPSFLVEKKKTGMVCAPVILATAAVIKQEDCGSSQFGKK